MTDLYAPPHLGHLMASALHRHRDAPVLHLGDQIPVSYTHLTLPTN